MKPRTRRAPRCLLPALACSLLLAGVSAPSAGAAYGGLGPIGASTIKPGSAGGHGEVNPSAIVGHDFAVEAVSGDIYIAEGVEKASEVRIEKFAANGEFVAENKIKVTSTHGIGLGGLAIDPAKEKVYLLVTDQRQAENEAAFKQLEAKEEQLFAKEEALLRAEEKNETARAEKLAKEIGEIEEQIFKIEEEIPAFDEEVMAAGELWSFSTAVKEGALKEPKALTKKEALQPYSESGKGPLVHPTGIAVDPKTHDVVIAGQQDESTRRGFGEEELRAVVERVHENGALGPRYIDRANCLDEGLPSAAEPACASEGRGGEFPQSPIVTPQGKVYVKLEGSAGELWEVPAAVESTGTYKEVVVLPKRLFTMTGAQRLLRFTGGGEAELPNTMAFAATGTSKGRIDVAADVEGAAGVVELEWTQEGENATVVELGWTAGEATQEKCAIPSISGFAPFVGANGEQVMLFGTKPEFGGEPALAAVFGFGPGGEACGHPQATPPKVAFGEQSEATEVPVGAATTLTSKVAGANAESTSWHLRYAGGEETPTSGYQFEVVSLPHAFEHSGKYEIEEEVHTDNLGTPTLKVAATQPLTVMVGAPKVKISTPGPVEAGGALTLDATVADPNEAEPHLRYVWDFGDGTAKVEGEVSGKPSPVTLEVEHKFDLRCPVACTVTLEVEDVAAKGKAGMGTAQINVVEGKAEREAREKGEKEAREAERVAREQREAKERGEREAGERAEREAAERKKQEEEAAAAAHRPEAKLLSGTLAVAVNGAFTVKISCPAGETACTGAVTLRTSSAVSAKAKKAILTLAAGLFSVPGGQTKAIRLHLSAKAKRLLARSRTLRALATLTAHDQSGKVAVSKRTVTLRLVKKKP